MRRFSLFILFLAGLGCQGACQTPSFLRNGWELAWSDDFNGSAPDSRYWTCREGARRDGVWSPEAIRVEGGVLSIRVYREGNHWISGAVETRGKFEERYGYWEARALLPGAEGHWPAFWLQSEAMGNASGPETSGAEIDIMEYHARWGDSLQHAVHWNGYGKDMQSAGKQVHVPGLAAGYHTFGLKWTPRKYMFYVDGKKTWTCRQGVSGRPQFIILSEEIGSWAGDIGRARLPDVFRVDYVRLYKK